MSDQERPLFDELLDYAVYAPLGLALTIVEDLPSLVAKGRSRLGTQVTIARLPGRMAAKQARRRVDDLLATDPAPAPEPPAAAPVRIEPSVAHVDTDVDLAIPGYDALAASQVVSRLTGLDAEELEAVRRHEAAHRGRRTILSRIEQLVEERSHG